jgi:hypothetical protein
VHNLSANHLGSSCGVKMRTHATRRQKLFWGLHIACTLLEHWYLAAAHCYTIPTEESLSNRRSLLREKSRGDRRDDQCAINLQTSTTIISAIPSPIAAQVSQQLHLSSCICMSAGGAIGGRKHQFSTSLQAMCMTRHHTDVRMSLPLFLNDLDLVNSRQASP